MALEVIGSGFGRTGTTSLKEALEILGFGPCHHMDEALNNPPQVALWQAYFAGRGVDIADLFAGYRAQLDWPGCHIWRESAARFPQAKVLHSVRPEEKWWASYSKTIGRLLTIYPTIPMAPHVLAMMEAQSDFIVERTFASKPLDRETCLAAYRARQAEVVAAIPPERLLIFDVVQGWEPLCAFLGVAVPDQPFPHRNDSASFWDFLGGEPA